jgi:hypothetical protein
LFASAAAAPESGSLASSSPSVLPIGAASVTGVASPTAPAGRVAGFYVDVERRALDTRDRTDDRSST